MFSKTFSTLASVVAVIAFSSGVGYMGKSYEIDWEKEKLVRQNEELKAENAYLKKRQRRDDETEVKKLKEKITELSSEEGAKVAKFEDEIARVNSVNEQLKESCLLASDNIQWLDVPPGAGIDLPEGMNLSNLSVGEMSSLLEGNDKAEK